MKRKEQNSMFLNKFVGFNIDEFIEKYLFEISEHITNEYLPMMSPYDYAILCKPSVEQYKEYCENYEKGRDVYHKQKRGVRNESILKLKIEYLQDLLLRKSFSKKDYGAFSLNSQILKAIIGDEYKVLLDIFIKMGYLIVGDGCNGNIVGELDYYQNGKYSKIFSIPSSVEVEVVYTTNQGVLKYKKKEKEQLERYRDNVVLPTIDEFYGADFRQNYEKSLRQIKIVNEKGIEEYISYAIATYKQRKAEEESKRKRKTQKGNPMIEHYYKYIITQLHEKNKKIQRIDSAGRIYHVLTNSDRNIKNFLNIKVSVDCKNSHPLLFNYFIFMSHGISNSDAYAISRAMHSIPYGSGKEIKQELTSIINDDVLCRFSVDELEYIYLTSNGMLWDVIASEHPTYDRNEVKESMFAEVFYSNKVYVYKWQKFAVDFKGKYPNVIKLIKTWKKDKNISNCKKYISGQGVYSGGITAKNALSIAMMNLEAQIFTQILRRMYSKRWSAVHIHDCIIVPNTRSNNQPTREQVIEIMEDVYKKYGLSPTFSE